MSPAPLSRTRSRGFTLVELLVALSAGLLLSAAAFVLARQATSFFRAEATLGSAQFASMLGLSRLSTDLRRAGFMASPNVVDDPRRCGATGGWPPGMLELASLRIEEGGSVARHAADHALSTVNGLAPDALIIGGMHSGTEHYAVQAMFAGGGGWTIVLQNDGAMVRTLLRSANPADPVAALSTVFTAGRILRLVDPEGREAYGMITGLGLNGTNPQVTIAAIPDMPTRDSNGVCGCKLPCVGSLVNPVSRVIYDLRTVDPGTYPQYQGLYSNTTHGEAARHKGMAEPARTELVRVELDANDAEIPATLEVIAEYAVDLKFGLTSAAGVAPGVAPTLTRQPIGSPAVYALAASLAAGGQPEDIRAVQVRLTTRVARRDRDVGIPNPGPDPAADGVFRYNLGANQGFARTRTAVTEVQMANYDVSW